MAFRARYWVLVLTLIVVGGGDRHGTKTAVVASSPFDGFVQRCICQTLTAGSVDGCCCEVEAVDEINAYIKPALEYLLDTPAFRYYRLNLNRECPFWEDSSAMCMMRACSVEACEPAAVPECWQCDEAHHLDAAGRGGSDGSERGGGFIASLASDHDAIDPLKRGHAGQTSSTARDVELDNLWTFEDESSFLESTEVIDLKENPERFTGYSGESARAVWSAVYDENCFEGDGDGDGSGSGRDSASSAGECFEYKVFRRLISGLHASISTHLSAKFFFEDSQSWGANLPEFLRRVGRHPDRVNNLYFTYLVVLRAVSKAAPFLTTFNYNPRNAVETAAIQESVSHLIDSTASVLSTTCPVTFDENSMFKGPNAHEVMSEFASHFHNISRIMDCVGCEKCRLWGKIQTTGLGTALKILFGRDDADIFLQRTEVVALINFLGRLSESIESVGEMRDLEVSAFFHRLGWTVVVASAGAAAMCVAWCGSRDGQGVGARMRRDHKHSHGKSQ